MARSAVAMVLLLAFFCAFVASPALARRSSSRRLNSGSSSYPKGGGSSGSSPSSSTPYPGGSSSPSSGSSPSGGSPSPTPVVTVPPVTSSPSPVTIPPVTSSPGGRYGGYGTRSGMGTSGFFGRNPNRIPKLLSLVSTLAKLFGPRLLKLLKGRKPPTILGALKDTSPLPFSSLAREATSSLINAYSYKDFPLSTGQVVSQFNAALDTPQTIAQQALKFQQLNEGV
ncbi:hypothetical protein L7F22_032690 [Adiantum nelumboides]|nr:hypothetical protein [Adiantum nelumboides]